MKTLKQIPIEKRKQMRANIEELRDKCKTQMELLSELYCLPNKILVEKADEVLKGKCYVEEFLATLQKTRERMNEVMRLRPIDDKKEKIYNLEDFETDVEWLRKHFSKDVSEDFILNILKKTASIGVDALITERKI